MSPLSCIDTHFDYSDLLGHVFGQIDSDVTMEEFHVLGICAMVCVTWCKAARLNARRRLTEWSAQPLRDIPAVARHVAAMVGSMHLIRHIIPSTGQPMIQKLSNGLRGSSFMLLVIDLFTRHFDPHHWFNYKIEIDDDTAAILCLLFGGQFSHSSLCRYANKIHQFPASSHMRQVAHVIGCIAHAIDVTPNGRLSRDDVTITIHDVVKGLNIYVNHLSSNMGQHLRRTGLYETALADLRPEPRVESLFRIYCDSLAWSLEQVRSAPPSLSSSPYLGCPVNPWGFREYTCADLEDILKSASDAKAVSGLIQDLERWRRTWKRKHNDASLRDKLDEEDEDYVPSDESSDPERNTTLKTAPFPKSGIRMDAPSPTSHRDPRDPMV